MKILAVDTPQVHYRYGGRFVSRHQFSQSTTLLCGFSWLVCLLHLVSLLVEARGGVQVLFVLSRAAAHNASVAVVAHLGLGGHQLTDRAVCKHVHGDGFHLQPRELHVCLQHRGDDLHHVDVGVAQLLAETLSEGVQPGYTQNKQYFS